jgi:hypothetical protein
MSNIAKKRKKNGFTQISNSVFEDERLSYRAKGVLGYLLSRPNNWKFNKTDLVRRSAEGRDAVYTAIEELKELNYLHIYPNYENGKLNGWTWEYDDTPFTPESLENSTTEKQQEIGEIRQLSSTTDFQYDCFSERQFSSTYNNTVFNNTNNNNNKEKEIKTIKITTGQLEEEFENIWRIYPRKIGKKKSFDSFKKARKIKKIPYETIENGLYRYIRYLEQQGTDEQYIMHGSTWFGQEKWQDEYILTGIKQKPKNINEYMRQKYGDGGFNDEPPRDRKIIDSDTKCISDIF